MRCDALIFLWEHWDHQKSIRFLTCFASYFISERWNSTSRWSGPSWRIYSQHGTIKRCKHSRARLQICWKQISSVGIEWDIKTAYLCRTIPLVECNKCKLSATRLTRRNLPRILLRDYINSEVCIWKSPLVSPTILRMHLYIIIFVKNT